jgi:hypothetical protein
MKKILLIIAITLCIFQMVVLAESIDVGYQGNGTNNMVLTGKTFISKRNPANATGKITQVEIWGILYGNTIEIATFYNVSGDNFTTRDTETKGTAWSDTPTQFIFDVELDVQEGDYIGVYCSGTSSIRATNFGYEVCWWQKTGDYIPCTNETFTSNVNTNWGLSIYGTGATTGWSHKWNTITIGKWNTKEIMKWNDLE